MIVSNVLSRMLNRAAVEGRFGYHPFCHKVKVTHLSFADDILVFPDGKKDPFRVLWRCSKSLLSYQGLI